MGYIILLPKYNFYCIVFFFLTSRCYYLWSFDSKSGYWNSICYSISIYLSVKKTLSLLQLYYYSTVSQVSSLWQALTSRYGPYTILIPVFSIQEELRIPTILHIPRQFCATTRKKTRKEKKEKRIFFSTSLLPIVKWLCCYID